MMEDQKWSMLMGGRTACMSMRHGEETAMVEGKYACYVY